MNAREIFLAIAKANQHSDPEEYADFAMTHFDEGAVEPETQPD
jgi:hypothetical protein